MYVSIIYMDILSMYIYVTDILLLINSLTYSFINGVIHFYVPLPLPYFYISGVYILLIKTKKLHIILFRKFNE